jgi:ankyrin repeat protein
VDDGGNFVNPLGDVERWTPVHAAVEMSEYEVLSALLDAGADPNELCFGHTLLTRSTSRETVICNRGTCLNTAATAILLAYGADPRLPAADGETPLQIAEHYNHEPAMRLLQRFLARSEKSEN